MRQFFIIIGMVTTAFIFVLSPLYANALTVPVYAYNNSSSGGTGVNTGIALAFGQAFTVAVNPNDLWNAGPLPRWSNADGLTGDRYATGIDESGEAAGTLIGQNFGIWTQNNLSAPYGTLVGELSGTYFVLGTSFSGPAPAGGNLKLYYWDSNNYDNTDLLEGVNVNINGVPEPTTILLIGFGLMTLAGIRRKRHIR